MNEPIQEFSYRKIELYKTESLGHGSYGGVCRAKCDELPCAAKIMHRTLFDLRDLGTVFYLEKFEEECRLLSLARHPNIVQYLTTYRDPETRLPVLLMEMCDESLTKFLERSPGPLLYHTELNISHDIVLALVYLHSNRLIHRDLTSNNVLMIAGVRAKVTDFGMSKLASVNPRMTPMTLCPGNQQYMSPEALEEPPSYTEKLDVFSFGVLLVQIMTRQFPDAGPRFEAFNNAQYPNSNLRVLVPEMQRRSTHIALINDTHSMKPIALSCLKYERPSALQLCKSLSKLKQAAEYVESEINKGKEISSLQKKLQELQEQMRQQKKKIQENEKLRAKVEDTESVLQENKLAAHLNGKERGSHEQAIAQCQDDVSKKNRELNTKDEALKQHLPQEVLSKLQFEKKTNAPQQLYRGSAVVSKDTLFLNPGESHKVYAFQISDPKQWSTLPQNKFMWFSLVVIEGLLTSIGGCSGGKGSRRFNTLLTLTDEKKWSEMLPSMPTPRSEMVAVTTQKALIVTGGFDGRKNLDVVEVLDISTKEWTTARHLPFPFAVISGAINGDELYLGGGFTGWGQACKLVMKCSISSLLQQSTFSLKLRKAIVGSKRPIWHITEKIPIVRFTLASFNGHLLAFGGSNDVGQATAEVYRYDPQENAWYETAQTKGGQFQPLVAVLPDNRIFVSGGTGNTFEIGAIKD